MSSMTILRTVAAGMVFAACGVAHAQAQGQETLLKRGEYLSRVGDCMACHSAQGKPAYAGGLAIDSGMGTIYSTNITPDKEHGIGNYTEQQFADALRKGVRADGARLYPAMPYPDYAKISDEDVRALYTYFMHGVSPSSEQPPKTSLSFPFNMRWGLMFWNWAFTSSKPFAPPAGANEQVRLGAYLVEGLGHCSSCHTARGFAMNEKALDTSDPDFLAGGDLNGWAVPSLRGMPHWTQQDIVDYLAMGRNEKAAVAGEMTSVVYNSTSYMTDNDLKAIAAYLKWLPASGGPAAESRPAAKPTPAGSGAAQSPINSTIAKLTTAKNLSEGERLYMDNCAACHFVTGLGAPRVFPRLDGATIVQADNPNGLLSVILAGAETPSTSRAPSVLPMPGFAWRLNDEEVAQLASFVRQGWSNSVGAVTAGQVAAVRKTMKPE